MLSAEDPLSGLRTAEYETEAYYGLRLAPGLTLKAMLQGLFKPGGRGDASPITVAGLRIEASL